MAPDIENREEILVPPDGGWGWMVVLGVALANVVTQALMSVFGFLFAGTLHEMGVETTGAAILSNVMIAVVNFSGLMLGPLMRRFSFRTVAMAGGIFTASGLMLTSLSTTLVHMIITYSFFVGLGLGLLSPSTFVAVNSYFLRARGRAVGLAMAGTGLGQMLMPQAVRVLLDEYSFRGTVLILGALALNSLVGASLFHPVKWHSRRLPALEGEKEPLQKASPPKRNPSALSLCSDQVAIVAIKADNKRSGSLSGDRAEIEKSVTEKSAEEFHLRIVDKDSSESCWSKIVKIFDLDLLRDMSFVNLVIGLAAVYTAGMNFGMVFPFFLESVGLRRSEIAMCMSLLAGGDITCRLILPFLTDWARIRSRSVFLVGSLCLAGMRSWIATQSDLNWLMGISTLLGFVRGSTTVNLNLSISESCSAEKLPAALGINMVLKGITILMIGPFIGWFRDKTGSFPLCIHALSIMIVIPMIIWLIELAVKRHRCVR
ncbi:monocarboxylate transporter 12-B isoform X2 [Anabrus simplex]|uniref:monocarboxylate transporter 12-B isoform X2 n=1 Tax=Anabrus simplex TaxID=316456 RepID=UPI0035A3C6C3